MTSVATKPDAPATMSFMAYKFARTGYGGELKVMSDLKANFLYSSRLSTYIGAQEFTCTDVIIIAWRNLGT